MSTERRTIESGMIGLRPVQDGDSAFLLALYASLRAAELDLTGWSADQRAAFVAQQFQAQDAHYRKHYADARFDLVTVDDAAAGRLYVARWPDEIRIMDIALMPEWRGRGFGTRLLQDILDEGRISGRRVTIHVEIFNPAQALYARLGFRPIGEAGVHRLLEWRDPRAYPPNPPNPSHSAREARTC